MDNKQALSEAEKIRGFQRYYQILIEKCLKELKNVENQVKAAEMNCYMNGTDHCVGIMNKYLLKRLEINRKDDKEKIEHERKCWTEVRLEKRAGNEFQWEVKNEEDFREYQKYFECSKEFYMKKLSRIQEKIHLKKDLRVELIRENRLFD